MDEELLNRITTKISKEQIINYILETWSTPTIIECITTFQQEGLLKKPNDRKINPLSSKEIGDIENTSKGLVYEDPNMDSAHMGEFKDEEDEEDEGEEEEDEEEERRQEEKRKRQLIAEKEKEKERRQQQLIAEKEKEKERRQQQLIAEKEKEKERRQQQLIDEEEERRQQQLIDEEEERKRKQFVTEVTEDEEDERKKKKERVQKPGVLLFKIDRICYILKDKEGYKIIPVENRNNMYSEYKLSYKNKSFFNKFYEMNNELKSLYSVLNKKNRKILENIKKVNIYEYVLKDGKIINMEKSKLNNKLMEIINT